MLNLHTCAINVVTFERCPAVCYDKKLDEMVGYDMEIMNELKVRLNFTTNMKILKGYQPWGARYANLNYTGALGVLYKKEADIGFGNYYLKSNRLSIVDSTISYFAVPIVIVIPPG